MCCQEADTDNHHNMDDRGDQQVFTECRAGVHSGCDGRCASLGGGLGDNTDFGDPGGTNCIHYADQFLNLQLVVSLDDDTHARVQFLKLAYLGRQGLLFNGLPVEFCREVLVYGHGKDF